MEKVLRSAGSCMHRCICSGSAMLDLLDPPVMRIDLAAAVLVGDAGLDQEPIRHPRVVLADDLVGGIGIAAAAFFAV